MSENCETDSTESDSQDFEDSDSEYFEGSIEETLEDGEYFEDDSLEDSIEDPGSLEFSLDDFEFQEMPDQKNLKYKLRPINEVLEEFPEYKKGWTLDPETGEWSNPKFAVIKHMVVTDENGKPLWDQPLIEENEGAIILPYDTKNGRVRIGLIVQERPMPGKKYIEVPRGQLDPHEKKDYKKGAVRELEEETGIKVSPKDAELLTLTNTNSTYFKKEVAIIVVKVPDLDKVESKNVGDGFENIEKIKPYTFDEIAKLSKEGYLTDGTTTSTLFHFGIYKPEFYQGKAENIISFNDYETQYTRQPLNNQPINLVA
tara:strand:+ start:15643 stop:16584 length:942 start_codon:yes stop_codon:yes gene_type:complete